MSESPVIIIVLEGGCVQSVFAPNNSHTRVITIDHDTDGVSHDQLTRGMIMDHRVATEHYLLAPEIRDALREYNQRYDLDFNI